MLTLYHVPGARSMRSLWLLHELGEAFETHRLAFTMQALRHPDYLGVHPLGRVPALKDGDRVIFESGAIAQYLCWRFPEKGLGRAPGDADWPDWIQWIHYAETIAVHGASLVQQQVFIPPDQKSPAVADLEGKRLMKALEVVDRHLQSQPFMLKAGFSAADTSVCYSVHLAKGFKSIEKYPALTAYYDRCAARPAFQATLAEDARAP
jgi:glutathione S-transferase